MVKKIVPNWLNSPLWFTPHPADYASPSDDHHHLRRSASVHDSPVHPPPVEVRPEPTNPNPEPVKNSPRQDADAQASTSSSSSSSTSSSSASSPSTLSISPEEASRQAQFLVQLSKKVVNMREVRRLVSVGIPDGSVIRPTLWKLLLGYLPSDRGSWSSELAKKRFQYRHLKDELLVNPSELIRRLEKSSLEKHEPKLGSRGPLSRSEVAHGEHPLSLGKSSIWNQFFQDTEIIEQIDRDVHRTHPDMPFFSADTPFANSNREAMKRILIVFAKLNPGIRYVQGMNELLAPLFYVFRNDRDEENVAHSEADTFFCFVELLSGFRDNFCQQLDNSVVGIRSTIVKLSQILRDHDEELWRHLEVTCKVNPQFYAFRWITLLLTQEFAFSNILHIWDTVFSDPEGPQETLLRICCAMLILVRRRLLAGDFTSNLKLLQSFPATNIHHLLYVANKLRSHPSS